VVVVVINNDGTFQGPIDGTIIVGYPAGYQ